MQVPPVVRRRVQLTFRGVRGAARIRSGLAAPCLPILFSACRAEGQTRRSEWGPIMQRKSCTLRSSQHHDSLSAVSRSSRIPHFVRRLPESASPINVAETANASLDMTAAAVEAAPIGCPAQQVSRRAPHGFIARMIGESHCVSWLSSGQACTTIPRAIPCAKRIFVGDFQFFQGRQ